MFKYSIDEFIAEKQKENALSLLSDMKSYSRLVYFPELDKLFDKHIRSYKFLEKLHEIALSNGDLIVMPVIPRDCSLYGAKLDLDIAYSKLSKSRKFNIPYIEFSSSNEDSNYNHGYDFRHVYIMFFTQFDFKESCNLVLYYFHKLNNLKAFW